MRAFLLFAAPGAALCVPHRAAAESTDHCALTVYTTIDLTMPDDATVLDWQWDGRAKEFFVGVRHDTHGDGQYTDEGSADLLVAHGDPLTAATPVIDPSILATLPGVLH